MPTKTAVPSPNIPVIRPTDQPTIRPADQPTTAPTLQAINTPPPLPTAPTAQPAPADDPVLVGAGDIAVCNSKGDEATAALIDTIPGTVFTLGDNAYQSGTPQEFQDCYDPSWGRLKARTHPIPGNHDYVTAGARGYFQYFGANAGDPARGYYSYNIGTWHILALNSETDTGANSEEVNWLRADLAQYPAQCTLAMFHRPLFSSGPHGRDGSGDKTRPLWDVLYENNVDVILNGHDHDYERFAPQDPDGKPDPARGIREFVVGTGGAAEYVFGAAKPNSEKRLTAVFGVIKLTLHATTYDWNFVTILPLLFKDSGTGGCH